MDSDREGCNEASSRAPCVSSLCFVRNIPFDQPQYGMHLMLTGASIRVRLTMRGYAWRLVSCSKSFYGIYV